MPRRRTDRRPAHGVLRPPGLIDTAHPRQSARDPPSRGSGGLPSGVPAVFHRVALTQWNGGAAEDPRT